MMSLIRDRSIHTAVERDGLPRVAAYDDGIDRVLFLDGEIVRSVEASAWIDALPTDPTPAESVAAIAAREAERGNRQAAALLRRQRAHDLAQSAVGVEVGALTPRQVEALLGLLLLRAGALDDDLLVRPLEEWVE
jgi:hypothetical protein